MPYAQSHYQFENKRAFDSAFPAGIITEGVDQTRAWFYTLLVVSTALFNQPPYKNLIVNGLVLARYVEGKEEHGGREGEEEEEEGEEEGVDMEEEGEEGGGGGRKEKQGEGGG